MKIGSARQSKIGNYLVEETERGLSRWLFLSISVMTALALLWVTYSYTSSMSTTGEVINSILENRSNTFSEMSIQRDLEQFIAARNADGLIRFNILIDRAGTNVAQVGELSYFGLTRKWDLASVTSPQKYQIQLNTSMVPFVILYLLLFTGIWLTYRWMLRSSMANFRRSFDTISSELENVLAELSQGIASKSPEKSFLEFSELRRLSGNWRIQLESYKEEIAALYYAKAESKVAQQVAHDIRSPLSVLKILSQLKGPLTGEHREIVSSAVDRIGRIADDLHEIAKKSLSRSVPKCIDQNEVEKIWNVLCEEKNLEASGRKIVFRLNSDWLEEDKITARDETQLHRTLSNLVNNSLKAAPLNEVCEISLKLIRAEGNIGIEISDNGPGIPAGIKAKLGPTPVSENGTGIGLSSAFRWMQEEGGRVVIHSDIKFGTSVKLLWPSNQRR